MLLRSPQPGPDTPTIIRIAPLIGRVVMRGVSALTEGESWGPNRESSKEPAGTLAQLAIALWLELLTAMSQLLPTVYQCSRKPHPGQPARQRKSRFYSFFCGALSSFVYVSCGIQGTRRAELITTGSRGTFWCPLFVPVATSAMASTTSMPSATLPKTQ